MRRRLAAFSICVSGGGDEGRILNLEMLYIQINFRTPRAFFEDSLSEAVGGSLETGMKDIRIKEANRWEAPPR